jgi:hypothetical protein
MTSARRARVRRYPQELAVLNKQVEAATHPTIRAGGGDVPVCYTLLNRESIVQSARGE